MEEPDQLQSMRSQRVGYDGSALAHMPALATAGVLYRFTISRNKKQILLCSWEKEMTTHSTMLAWRIPWTEEPGRLQSMGLQITEHS